MERQDESREKFLVDIADAYYLQDEPRDIFLRRFAYKKEGKHQGDKEFAQERRIDVTTLSTHMTVIYEAFAKSPDKPFGCDINPRKRGRGKLNKLYAWLWLDQFPLWRDNSPSWKQQFPIRQLPKIEEAVLPESEVSFTQLESIPSNIYRSGVSPDRFFGRSQELEQLHQLLQQGNRVAIAAIAGMGGVGKTELAIQYAEKYKEFYPGGVCWLRAGESNLGSQIVQFAQFPLGLSVPQEWGGKPLNLDQQVAWCWQHWQPPGSVLVVLDDVTDLVNCQDALPPTNRYRVLVTTRKRQLDASFFELSLDVLKPLAALKLLESLIKRERLKREPWSARRLCKWLGYLPLGLELVGRYLAEDPDLSLAEMLERLQTQSLKDESLDLDEQQKQKNYPLMTAERGVRAAFELSWQEFDSTTKNVGCLLSLFAPAVIPWKLVESTTQLLNWTIQDVHKARKHLFKRHLIQRTSEGLYQIHSLIREFLKGKLTGSPQAVELKRAFAAAMAAVANQIPDHPSYNAIAAITSVVRHIVQAATDLTVFLSDEVLIKPFTALSRFYSSQGFYEQAQLWDEQCLSVAQTRFGSDHPDVATCLNNLAYLYHVQGHYDDAETLYLQALAIEQRLLKTEHSEMATSLNNLAELYRDQARYEEAEALLLQTLKLKRLGNDPSDVVYSLNNLALLYYFQGRYSEAEPLYMETLSLWQRCLGTEHPDFATTLNNLANLYQAQGRYSEAEPLQLQAIELRKHWLGEEHPHIANSLRSLANLYQDQGRYSEAESLFLQTLELQQRFLGLEHPEVTISLNMLANVYNAQGRYSEAEPVLVRALEIEKCLLGDEHPNVAATLNNLANLYHRQGHDGKAESLLKKSIEIQQGSLGNEQPRVTMALSNLAGIYYAQHRYNEAESLLKKVLQIRQVWLGNDHPQTADSLHNLAELYHVQEHYNEAESLHLQALELRKRLLGAEHPDIANSLSNLASLYHAQGRHNEAESLHLQALDLKKRLLGAEHPDIAVSLNNLANLYFSEKRYTEAEPLLVKALEICERQLGVAHPHTIGFSKNLAIVRATLSSNN